MNCLFEWVFYQIMNTHPQIHTYTLPATIFFNTWHYLLRYVVMLPNKIAATEIQHCFKCLSQNILKMSNAKPLIKNAVEIQFTDANPADTS